MEDFRLIDWAMGGIVSITGWFGATTMSRVRRLELDKQNTAKAEADRAEIKQDIRDLSSRMDDQHQRLFDRLDDISDRMPTGKR